MTEAAIPEVADGSAHDAASSLPPSNAGSARPPAASAEVHSARTAACAGTAATARAPSRTEGRMNTGKVVFGFFILLAATLNFGFVVGDIGVAAHHQVSELFAAIVVNIVATILKLGDRTQLGAIHLASSLVAVVQLVIAAVVWSWGTHVQVGHAESEVVASVVSLAAGALFANVVSVVLLIAETLSYRR